MIALLKKRLMKFWRTTKFRLKDFKSPLVVFMFVLLVIECASLVYGLYWGFICSLKSINNYMEDVFGWPWEFRWSNYSMIYNKFYYQIFTETGYKRVLFPTLLLNSLLYATLPEFIKVFCFASVAYVVNKYRFKFNKVMTGIVLFTMIFPQAGSIGASLTFLKDIGFYDNYWALLYGNIIFADFQYLIWAGTWQGVDNGYMEAARIDGASELQIMLFIMFPLARVTFMIYLILGFIGGWNNYGIPLITMPSMPNLALALYQFEQNSVNAISWPPFRLAATYLVAIPCVVLYLIVEPYLVGNLTIGGLKG